MRSLARLPLVFALALLLTNVVRAQTCTTEWAQPADGVWTDAASWTAGVPGAGDTACITVGGTYTVSLGVSDPISIAGLDLGGPNGTQTLEARRQFSITGNARVGTRGQLLVGSTSVFDFFRVDGTLLIEGLARLGPTRFMDTGGTLDIAPNGRVTVLRGTTASDASATFRVRGTLDTEGCGQPAQAGTCAVNAVLDVDGGTIRSPEGLLTLRGGGTLTNITVGAAANAFLQFSRFAGVTGTYVLTGTMRGTPEGVVSMQGGNLAAGSGTAVLDVGGSGLRFAGGFGAESFLTSAGGEFLNTGRLVQANNAFTGVRTVVLRNQGVIAERSGLILVDGATVRNEPDGLIVLGEDNSSGVIVGNGRVINEGRIVGVNTAFPVSISDDLLVSEPGSVLESSGVRLNLTGDAARVTPADVTLTGTGGFLFTDVVHQGTVSPGTEAQPIATLTFRNGTFRPSPFAGVPQLVIDVDEGGVSDQIAVPASTGGQTVQLAGALVVRVRPGYVPTLGDTFTILTAPSAIEGRFGQTAVEGAPDGLTFVTELVDNDRAVQLRAVAVAPDGPVTVSTTDPVGGGVRSVFLTGPGVVGVTAARLDCTTCLDPSEPVATTLVDGGAVKRVELDLTSPRLFGFYNLVLTRPGLADEVVPITVRPYLSVGPGGTTLEQGIRVRPAGQGYNTSRFALYGFSNAREASYPFVKVYRPAPDDIALGLSTLTPLVPGPAQFFFDDDARDELAGPPLLVTRLPEGVEAALVVGLRIDPSRILFPEQTPTGPDDDRFPFGEELVWAVATLPNASLERAVRTAETGLRQTGTAALTSYLAAVDDADADAVAEAVLRAMTPSARPTYLDRPSNLLGEILRLLDDTVPTPAGLAEDAAQSFAIALDVAVGTLAVEIDLAHGEALVDGPTEVGALLRAEADALAARARETLGIPEPAGASPVAPTPTPLAFARQGGGGWDPSVPIPSTPSLPFLSPPKPKGTFLGGVRNATVDPIQRAENLYGSGGGGGGGSTSGGGGGGCSSPSAPADPNDKLIQSNLPCEFGTVVVDGEEVTRCVRTFIPLAEATSPLGYAITFENLPQATAPAEFVTIVDTLSADLDPNTLEVLETSSDSTFSFTVEGQVVTFRFVGIDLPPNVTPPEGEGFVAFTVQPRPGLEEGTAIDNRASIVFDFNPPILTPTVTYELRAVADLDVAVAAMPEQNVGETATFEVQVANVTTDEAMETELVILPPDAPLVSVTPSVGTCTGTMPIVCDLGTLAGIEAGGTPVVVEVVVEAEAKGELTLSASATTSAFDGFLPNNSAAATVTIVTVGTETESGLPASFTLDTVYPNPTTRDATIRYGLPEADRVDLVVYDLLGRRVAVLADDAPQPAGWHDVALDTSRLASGVYVCQFRAGGTTQTRKLTVLR